MRIDHVVWNDDFHCVWQPSVFFTMIFFHSIYLSAQNRGLVTHGSFIEVIFQTKAPFSNQKTMNIGVWVFKKGHVWTQIRKLLPCSKNHRDSHPPPRASPLNIADVVEKTFQHRGVLRILRGRNFSSDVTWKEGWEKNAKTEGFKQGGGFNYFWIFTHTWGNDPIWRAYFSDGLTPPTRFEVVSFLLFQNLVLVYGLRYLWICVIMPVLRPFLNEWTSSWDKPCDLSSFCETSFHQQGFEGPNTSSSVQCRIFEFSLVESTKKKTSLVESTFWCLFETLLMQLETPAWFFLVEGVGLSSFDLRVWEPSVWVTHKDGSWRGNDTVWVFWWRKMERKYRSTSKKVRKCFFQKLKTRI